MPGDILIVCVQIAELRQTLLASNRGLLDSGDEKGRMGSLAEVIEQLNNFH